MIPVVSAEVVRVEKLSAALGFIYVAHIVVIYLAPPIATAILRAHDGNDMGPIAFAGLPVGVLVLYLDY